MPSTTGATTAWLRGAIRVAPATARADWGSTKTELPALRAPALELPTIRDAWATRAAMEHAGVAAFARFGAQLQALAAPASLVRAAHQASLDELRHAQICYALTSQLAADLGEPALGPGAITLRSLDLAAPDEFAAGPEQVLVEAILDGCVGGTIAAAKLRYLAGRASSPALRELLANIAADEAGHAALAWRSLRWMIARFDLRALARQTFAGALACTRARAPGPAPLEPFGVLDDQTSRWLSTVVSCQVIAPAAAELLAAPTARRADGLA